MILAKFYVFRIDLVDCTEELIKFAHDLFSKDKGEALNRCFLEGGSQTELVVYVQLLKLNGERNRVTKELLLLNAQQYGVESPRVDELAKDIVGIEEKAEEEAAAEEAREEADRLAEEERHQKELERERELGMFP
jgi:hypothetical protein